MVVDWKANNTSLWHSIMGSDFELVDSDGRVYELRGMFIEENGEEKYEDQKYKGSEVKGSGSDTYKIVFDVPRSAKGFKLWFQDFPKIELTIRE